MRSESLGKVAVDLLSIPPLIFRLLRRKLIKTTLADIDVDIKFPHLEIMKVLREEGTLHVAEIGEKLQIAKAQMTHLIDKLVDLNLVERRMNSADRRTLNIALTARGRALLDEHENFLVNTVRDYMSSLSDKELETFSSSLRNLRDTLFKLQ
ncbi:MAG TPA: MarR family transcriptional regulator [Dehalococcoidales bacterium]|nr:MarR family transcriptional regulator [Dehalococcoidales bacterium]